MIEILAVTSMGGKDTYIAETSAAARVRELLSQPRCQLVKHGIMVWAARQGSINLPASWLTFQLGGPRVLLRGLVVFTGSALLSAQGLTTAQRKLLDDLYDAFLRSLEGT